MKVSRVYFGTFVCVFGQVFGYSIDYIKNTANTCPCKAGSLSLIQCTAVCVNDQSSDCKGVSFDLGNRTCCVCTTSIYGIPDQASESRSVMYRTIKKDRICAQMIDLVNYIPDDHITASSSWDVYHGTTRARLYTTNDGDFNGAWSPATNNPTEYIQARFYDIKEVFAVATQGSENSSPAQYVSSYNVSYSVDCVNFAFVKGPDNGPKVFPGNFEIHVVIYGELSVPLLAVCIRVHPVTYRNYPSLRFGIIGCDL